MKDLIQPAHIGAQKRIVSLKAAVAFIILCVIIVAFPPKTYWSYFLDLSTGELLLKGASVRADHLVAEIVEPTVEMTAFGLEDYLQKRHDVWEPIWKSTSRTLNTRYLILEFLAAFCLTMIPGLRSTSARVGAVSVVIVVAAAVIIFPPVQVSSGLANQDPTSRAFHTRSQVHERILQDMSTYLANGVGAPTTSSSASLDQLEKYRAALASIESLDVSANIALQDAIQSDPIRPLIDFYLVTTGCADQLAYSRSEFVNSPMLEALFFDSTGQEVKDAALKLGISTFVVAAEEEKKFVRVNTKKIAQVSIPIWWLQEDALLLQLSAGIQAGVKRVKLHGILTDVTSVRSSHRSSESGVSETRVDELLSQVRAALRAPADAER